ncbi:MAG TPA: RNA polymerase sigma-70 factor [Puia sp.]|nr:RNA polymerase sigma-70 factor [Puia sp.]
MFQAFFRIFIEQTIADLFHENSYDVQKRLSSGDEIALKELYISFSSKLFQLAFAIVRSKEMAEEVVEDVFIKVWKKRVQMGKVENFTFYLYVMTKNTSRDYLRKYGNIKKINLDDVALPFYRVDTPEDLMITAEVITQINKAINELPTKCRLIFKLVKEDGLKYREVAELLHLSKKTVENQVGIALKKIHGVVNICLPRSIRSPFL